MNEGTKSENLPEEKVEQKEETQVDPRVKELEEQLAKEQEEKENYKQGMLKYKEQVKEEEPETEWNEDTKKFQKETLTKAERMAEEKAMKTVETFNEKAGIAKFKELHPDVEMKEVLANYNPKNGKFSAESVVRDLERALVLHQYDTGKLSTKEAEAEAKGKKKGAAESKVADLSAVSKTTSKATPQGAALTESEKYIAGRMKVDIEKLAEEDLSQPAQIDLI